MKVVLPAAAPAMTMNTPESYRTEVEVLIMYTGSQMMRVEGCRSGNRYLFAPGAQRSVDINDAECLVELPGFEYG